MEPGHLKALSNRDYEEILPLVVCRFYGWAWSEVREMNEVDYARAVAVMAGIQDANGSE